MKKIARDNWVSFTTIAAAMLFAAGAAPFLVHAQVQAQSKYASGGDTIVLLTGQRNARLTIDGSTCTATSSGNSRTSAIVMSVDGNCWCWATSAAIPWPLDLKIMPDEISFRSGGRTYVIRDSETVRRAHDIFAPVRDAIQKQADRGRQMNELGSRQQGTSVNFSEARVSVPDLSTEFRKVEAEAKRLSAEGGTQSELSELQSELSELQGRISELQSEASDQRSQIGAWKSEISSQMLAMSEEMSVWSSEGEKAAEQAARQVKELLDQSIANGIARAE